MGKLENAKRVGIRDMESNKLLGVYPHTPKGTDSEIDKTVRDWYYQQDCAAEDQLISAYVDALTDSEVASEHTHPKNKQ